MSCESRSPNSRCISRILRSWLFCGTTRIWLTWYLHSLENLRGLESGIWVQSFWSRIFFLQDSLPILAYQVLTFLCRNLKICAKLGSRVVVECARQPLLVSRNQSSLCRVGLSSRLRGIRAFGSHQMVVIIPPSHRPTMSRRIVGFIQGSSS